jgi:peptidoglycan/LPS O-acetylase OafA/YrhL
VRAAVTAFVVDACLVLVFATVGRASHDEGLDVAGVLGVAWPFLGGLAVGWLVARRRGAWPVGLRGGALVWLVTALGGLVLRVLAGGGFAWSFGLVTLLVLGIFLVGWRCAVEVGRFVADGLARWSAETARRSARR